MPEPLTDAQKVVRNDTGKRIAVALEALASEVEPSTVIAPEYDPTLTYAVGDLVIYRSVLYRCTTAITTPEEWTAAHWTATSVSDAYRQAVDQDAIDANLMALGLSGASVGDLVRVKTVDANGKPTSWQKAPLCEIKTNPNLLDNWYFVGGGSQQGGGQFPINQRGQTSYTNTGYCIDRWKYNANSSVHTLALQSGCIRVTRTDSSANPRFFEQPFPSLASGTYTASVIYRSNVTHDSNMRFVIADSGGTAIETKKLPVSSTWNLVEVTVNRSPGMVRLQDYSASDGDGSANVNKYIEIMAIKLELGSEQTLAHQENGAWVLNELPNYLEELSKCRRYFQVLEARPGVGNGQYFPAVRGYSNATVVLVPVEPPMAKNIKPSLPDDGIQGAAVDGAGTSRNLTSVASASSTKNFGIYVSDDLDRTPIVVYLNKRIYLSAEP